MNKKTLIPFIFLIATFTYLLFVLGANAKLFLSKYDHIKYQRLYEQSQWQKSQNISEEVELEKWALSKGYTGWNNFKDTINDSKKIASTKNKIINTVKERGISDAQLYSYVGYEYAHGKDPTLLNPEHPPLGKYLIGLSIMKFRNENIVLVATGVLSLIVIFLIVFFTTKSATASSMAVFLTATLSLFTDQLIHGPQLDIFQLLFFLLVSYFLILTETKKKLQYLILTGIFFGLLISVKTFFSYYLLFSAWLFIYFFLIRKNRFTALKDFAVIQGIGLIIFCTTYLSFFLQGGTLKKFLGVQKYIIMFYRQSGINPVPFFGNYLRLIFTGSWKFWSAGNVVSKYQEWSFLWIPVFIAGILITLKFTQDHIFRKNQAILLFLVFLCIYNVFLFFFPVFPRYLLLLFVPINIIIALYVSRRLS